MMYGNAYRQPGAVRYLIIVDRKTRFCGLFLLFPHTHLVGSIVPIPTLKNNQESVLEKITSKSTRLTLANKLNSVGMPPAPPVIKTIEKTWLCMSFAAIFRGPKRNRHDVVLEICLSCLQDMSSSQKRMFAYAGKPCCHTVTIQ